MVYEDLEVCCADRSFITAAQNPREYDSLSPRYEELNFQLSDNLNDYTGKGPETLHSQYNAGGLRQLGTQSFYLNTLNTLFLEAPYNPTFSTAASIDSLEHDHANKLA